MVLIPSSVSKSTGKYCLMKHCMVTLPFPTLKSKGKYCMAEKPSHVSRVSLSYPVEIGLRIPTQVPLVYLHRDIYNTYRTYRNTVHIYITCVP